ncbi:MAG: sigma-54-dependent Fis family transcriptional regulator [Planctomycetes bacterium]|nr:sigma-54-dependent Fis family transcriptional regulator [Planctomycetota bacterium]
MRDVIELIARVADAELPVLILGESGTGKELVARALHDHSSRRKSPFVAVNLAALPSSLVEDELFGHVAGAFTGAMSTREGRFRRSDGGTLFLDEIGDIPAGVQAKLLRAIERGSIEPLGSEQEEFVNVRVIAATHRDLHAMASSGAFRPDLLFRLSVIPVELPPLRARSGDIELLASHFAKVEIEKLRACTISPEAMDKLIHYPWPGNVRELENSVLRARALASTDELVLENFEFLFEVREGRSREIAAMALRHGIQIAEMERAMLEEALRISNGNETEAARRLGLSRRSLDYRIDKKRN